MDSYLSSEEEEAEDEDTEESSCEETEDDSSSQLTQYNNDKLEDVCLGSTRLPLPQGLCENEAIFKEFFSLDTWQNVLTANQREQLKVKFYWQFRLNKILKT
jgi:nuclear factor related to kappa-B-binding protein